MLESTSNDTIQTTDYTVTLDEDDNGDLMLPIPNDIMDELGWDDGDLLEWIVEDDQILLRKVEE
jgi:bifunctional DNA-binding transcriptional regulator/antitoxin component of YhaV-PrlF toxin-antitoxin module